VDEQEEKLDLSVTNTKWKGSAFRRFVGLESGKGWSHGRVYMLGSWSLAGGVKFGYCYVI